ncbi:Imm27 family immunity protein [Rufibacter psychrotolerans]|uniref:Imm27 family immunity protein n=1 Tax=Rufibacter psychrotolerans TaxID=2812556 RepID=UPI001966F406|nr:Imm27 family immunity protein [Rufibacter sp. SYSU D00308]
MRRLYSDSKLIDDLLQKLNLLETLDGGWAAKYRDNESGEQWLKYQINSGYHGGGQTNLIRLPEPTTAELIDIALNSEFEDEALAASFRLRDNEQCLDKEFRLDLIYRLKSLEIRKLSGKEKSRIKLVITTSALNRLENRREIIGKSSKEIEEDSLYFQRSAEEANSILEKL